MVAGMTTKLELNGITTIPSNKVFCLFDMVSRCFPYVSHVFPSPNSLKFAVMFAVTQPAGQPSVRCKPFQPQHVASWVFLKWPWSSKICQAGKFATEKVLREGCGDGDVVWIGQFIEHMYKNDWGCNTLW